MMVPIMGSLMASQILQSVMMMPMVANCTFVRGTVYWM